MTWTSFFTPPPTHIRLLLKLNDDHVVIGQWDSGRWHDDCGRRIHPVAWALLP